MFTDSFGALHFTAQQSRHELNGIMSLQKGRFVGDQSVSRRVRFVKTVTRERDDQIPEFLGDVFRDPIGNCSSHVFRMEAVHHIGQLFADRFNAFIRLGQLNVAHSIQNAHDLFLVDHHTVGLGQNFIHHRMNFARRLASVLYVNVFHHHPAFQRTRAIESGRRDNVREAVRPHLSQQIAHPAGLELEHALRLTSLQQREGLGVGKIILHLFKVEAWVRSFYVLNGLVQNRQVSQAQKVHLQQADFFYRRSVPLSNDVVFTGDRLQRQHSVQRHVRNHHAGRVSSRTASQALNGHRIVEQFFRQRIDIIRRFQVRTFCQRVFEFDIERIRDELCQFVDSSQRHVQRAADVADRVLGFQSSIRTNLSNVTSTVFLLCVVNNHLPAIAAEVDIDIGRFGSAGVQKAFEQQVIFQRANIPQSQQIGHDRSARRTSRSTGNAIAASKLHEVPYDQEVARVTLGFDNAQFIFQTLPVPFSQLFAIAFMHALLTEISQVIDVGLLIRGAKHRIQLAITQFDVDSVRDFLRPCHSMIKSWETRIHFVRSTNVEPVVLHLHAFFVIASCSRIHA